MKYIARISWVILMLPVLFFQLAHANLPPEHQTPKIDFYTEHFPPFAIDDQFEILGESVDLVRKMQRLLGQPDTIRIKPWARAYQKVLREPNSALFLTARTPAREALFKWVGPLTRDRVSLCQHKSDQNKYDDINLLDKDIHIAVTRGYPEQAALEKLGFNHIKLTNTPNSTINQLLKKRVTLISCSPKTLWDLLIQNATPTDEIHLTNIDLYEVELYIAFNHQTLDKTIHAWQHALELSKQSREYIELND
ncbi:substrate-binding periplasmic protein [Motilimonas sp. 1_MG-2023]|uniref:substrate-binding periplasmic protein n=1 Tax=Motilimonas TaxID=1914248 RepID=UPI0026E216B7|nr:transporter substrate-binding domain-containing protein [Motilimonas sp. 1_MG-2023]MDO6526122.1 transporter substrate-binding domain-containing protein [Motilimonas sp. 1_MG-2023]